LSARALAVVALLAVAACSGVGNSVTTGFRAGGDTSSLNAWVKHRLVQIAEQEAASMDGQIAGAHAVTSTHSHAVRVTSGAIVPGTEKVFVIQIEGVEPFVCNTCMRAPGAAAPSGRFVTIVLNANTFDTTDWGIEPVSANLASLGPVTDLLQ